MVRFALGGELELSRFGRAQLIAWCAAREMTIGRTGDVRKDAVRIALTSGPSGQ